MVPSNRSWLITHTTTTVPALPTPKDDSLGKRTLADQASSEIDDCPGYHQEGRWGRDVLTGFENPVIG